MCMNCQIIYDFGKLYMSLYFLYLVCVCPFSMSENKKAGRDIFSLNCSLLHNVLVVFWCLFSESFTLFPAVFSQKIWNFHPSTVALLRTEKFLVVRGSEVKAQWSACEHCSWGEAETDESFISLWQAATWCRLFPCSLAFIFFPTPLLFPAPALLRLSV